MGVGKHTGWNVMPSCRVPKCSRRKLAYITVMSCFEMRASCLSTLHNKNSFSCPNILYKLGKRVHPYRLDLDTKMKVCFWEVFPALKRKVCQSLGIKSKLPHGTNITGVKREI